MSDLTPKQYTVTIGGESYPYALNMAAYDLIAENGYSGEGEEGDFGSAFIDAENGNTKAAQLVVWAGIATIAQGATGDIDMSTAPPKSITKRMTFQELVDATAVASDAFIASLPPAVVEAAKKAAEDKTRPTKARRR